MYSALEEKLGLKKGVPYTPDWSAAPDFIELIVEHSLTEKPQTIVECSSGLTTLMLARCCKMNGSGHLYSLENGAEYAAKTRSYFERYELDEWVTVLDAPLEKMTIHGNEYLWYKSSDISNESIDMLVIDGPPGFMQKNARYPALPVLFERLSDHCVIFLDDAARDDEKELVHLWLNEHPEIEHEYIDTERGCVRLVINRKK
ncbi:MAG: class I SAM-dependent methyltransferase [Chromatiales bacterium]|nr:class I SAM-dependent methyltransferase [Chromatiales bacterium]